MITDTLTKQSTERKRARCLSIANIENFKTLLSNKFFESVMRSQSANDAYNNFMKLLRTI